MARRLLLLAPLALTLAACSGSVSIGSSDSLDTGKLESALEKAATAALPGFTVGGATCPGDVKREAGGTFTCTVEVEGQPVRFDVTQDDDKGNVSYQKGQAVLDVVKLQTTLADQIQQQAGVTTVVDCGAGKVLVQDVGATFTCDATAPDATVTVVNVKVEDLDGNVSFST